MRTLNRVVLRGYVAEKPKLNKTKTDKKVCNLSLITHRRRVSGQDVSIHPDFHRLVLWQGFAEVAEKYLNKGDVIYIEGEVHNDQYKTADGEIKYVNEIVVERLDIIATKRGNKLEIEESSDVDIEEAK